MSSMDPHQLAQLPATAVVALPQESELLRRAEYLPAEARALIHGVFRHGLTLQELGELSGVPKGTVSRRLRRYLKILSDPISIAVTHPRCTLEPALRELMLAHHLGLKSVTTLTGEFQLSRQEVLDRLAAGRGWLLRERHGLPGGR